ncbi:MAG: tellurite resistance TerB family protein [Mastigocoleus sp.]
MAQYDHIFRKQGISSTILTQEEAVVAIAVVTIAADASLDRVDSYSIIDTLWEFEVFEEYSDEELSKIVEKALAIANKEGVEILFNTAFQYLSDEIILDAFAVSVSMLVNEETLIIPPEKLPLIYELQAVFDLDDTEAEEIIDEVISILEEAEEFSFADEYETLSLKNLSQQYYESPEGQFKVYIPVSANQGGQVQTREGVTEFSDDSGTLLRIDYYRLSQKQKQDIKLEGKEKYLYSILIEKYVPLGIIANLPNSQIEYSEYLKEFVLGSYYVLVNMPQVVSKSVHTHNGNGARRNAYRGILAFINHDFLYIVSKQQNVVTKLKDNTLNQEVENIKLDIINFVETIEFQ